MATHALDRRLPDFASQFKSNPAIWIGVLVGIIMPVVSGLIYPTYYHKMPSMWVEWTRLMEAPFLICELLVICLAMHRGMEIKRYIEPLPRDLKIALGLLVVGVWFSSMFVSAVPERSVALSIATMIHILFAVAIYFFVNDKKPREYSGFWFALGTGLLVLCVYTAWRFLFPIPASQVPGGEIQWGFSLPGFISVRYFGTWTGAIAMFFVAMVIQRGDKVRPSWPEFFLFVAMAMTIWSATRAAILGLIVATAIMIVVQRRMPNLAVVGRLCIISGLGAIVAWPLLPAGNPDFQLFAFGEASNLDRFTSGRTELWIATYHKWLEAPWFGWGSGSIFWEVYLGWTHTQPHNAFLQFLISWGIVGAVGACWLLFRAIAAAHRKTKRNEKLWPITAMLYALLTMSMVDGALYYPRFIMLIIICFAFILSDNAGDDGQLAKAA